MDEWIQVLDDFEANLDIAEQQLDSATGGPPAVLAALVPPSGSMPSGLAARADALLGRSLDLEQAIAERLADRSERRPRVRWPQHRARRGRMNVAL